MGKKNSLVSDVCESESKMQAVEQKLGLMRKYTNIIIYQKPAELVRTHWHLQMVRNFPNGSWADVPLRGVETRRN